MTGKTSTERNRLMQQRRREAGLVKLELWTHPDDRDQLKRKNASLLARREREARRHARGEL